MNENEVLKSDEKERKKKLRFDIKDKFNDFKLYNNNSESNIEDQNNSKNNYKLKLFKPWEFMKLKQNENTGRISNNINLYIDKYDFHNVEDNFCNFKKNREGK